MWKYITGRKVKHFILKESKKAACGNYPSQDGWKSDPEGLNNRRKCVACTDIMRDV